jgi:hypothetical protein
MLTTINVPPNTKLNALGIMGRVGTFISLISRPPPIIARTINARPTMNVRYTTGIIASLSASQAKF